MTFAVEGVTSVSVDLHKYAYTPKGVSVVLHRTAALRRGHFFASADWPGYDAEHHDAVHALGRPSPRPGR